MERRLEKASRKLAYILRHKPEDFNISMDEFGQVSIKEVIKALNVSMDEFNKIVENDEKGRYFIKGEKVFAVQGHSIKGLKVPMEKLETCGQLFHGTKTSILNIVMNEGLKPQSREFVHLSKDLETAKSVANRRKGNSVILEIDGQGLIDSGIEVFEAINGVILVKEVPAEFISVLEYI